MYEYQDDGIAWLRERPRAYLGDEPGLGKTRQLLLAATPPVLWVGPAMVLDGGEIDDEIERWAPGLDVTQVSYSSLCRRTKGPRGGSMPVKALRPALARRWGTVVLDEAQYIKGRKTTWTAAAMKLQADRMYLASGTPIPNWAHELFTALQLLHPDEASPGGRFGSYWRWIEDWFKVHPGRFSMSEIGAPLDNSAEGWSRFHKANLGDLFLQRLRSDVLTDLPPMSHVWIRLPMKPQQARMYRELKRDYLAWADSGGEVSAWSSAGLHTKLAQLCVGLEVVDPSLGSSSAKLDALEERLRDQASPCLVLGHFRATVHQAAIRAARVGRRPTEVTGDTSRDKRRQAIADFKTGRADVLCATLDTIAEGMNLTVADTIHMLERSYRPSRNQQAVRRVHRIGQTRPVTVYHYVAKGTVDARMLPVLHAKRDQQVRALRAAAWAALL